MTALPKITQAAQGGQARSPGQEKPPPFAPRRKWRFAWGRRSQGGLGKEACGPESRAGRQEPPGSVDTSRHGVRVGVSASTCQRARPGRGGARGSLPRSTRDPAVLPPELGRKEESAHGGGDEGAGGG